MFRRRAGFISFATTNPPIVTSQTTSGLSGTAVTLGGYSASSRTVNLTLGQTLANGQEARFFRVEVTLD